MNTPHEINRARWINLLVPGGGLILLLSYWKTMMPEAIKAKITAIFAR